MLYYKGIKLCKFDPAADICIVSVDMTVWKSICQNVNDYYPWIRSAKFKKYLYLTFFLQTMICVIKVKNKNHKRELVEAEGPGSHEKLTWG